MSGLPSGACTTRLLDPSNLRLVRVAGSCRANDGADARGALVVDSGPAGDEVHVRVTKQGTRTAAAGPTVMTIQAWDWAHSSVAEGDGSVWIYGLGAFHQDSELLQVSATTGRIVRRFVVQVGPDPYLVVDGDGVWLTASAWEGYSCATACRLWHLAPASGALTVVRRLGIRTQWLTASGDSIYADVETSAAGGWRQAIWRLDGPQAQVAYETPATRLPSPSFSPFTGYAVVGTAQDGLFTLSELGSGTTPTGIGTCDASAPIRVVRIDPSTGSQSYVATIPPALAGAQLDCHLFAGQSVLTDGALDLLAGQWGELTTYRWVLRVAV